MSEKNKNLVSSREFCEKFDQYVRALKKGQGPIGVLKDSKIVGFFVAATELGAFQEDAILALIKSRMKGPTISHEEARRRVRQARLRATKAS